MSERRAEMLDQDPSYIGGMITGKKIKSIRYAIDEDDITEYVGHREADAYLYGGKAERLPDIVIELEDGSIISAWNSEWGGVKYFGTHK